MSLDFRNICRLCMNHNNCMLSLFSENDCLPNKIMIVVPSLKVFSGDGLPAQVCQQCVHQVNNFYDFKLQCETSDHMLQQHLSMHDPERQSNWNSTMGQENKVDIPEIIPEVSFSCAKEDVTENLQLESLHNDNEKSACMEEIIEPCQLSDDSDEKEDSFHETDLKKENCQAMDLSNSKYAIEAEEKTYMSLSSSIYKQSEVRETLTKNSDRRPHMCEQCGKRFKNRSNLKNHAVIHTGQKEFVCNACGKRFKLLDHLKTHSLTHTGEKAHVCDVCGKRFKLLGHLKTHTLIHTGKKSHICHVCGKSFSQIGNYKRHTMLHTGEKPFSCNLCGRSFREKNTLGIHIATHTGQKPYSCNICGKNFAQPAHLKAHTIVHTGEKKYCCHVCGKYFSGNQKLKKHLAVHNRQ